MAVDRNGPSDIAGIERDSCLKIIAVSAPGSRKADFSGAITQEGDLVRMNSTWILTAWLIVNSVGPTHTSTGQPSRRLVGGVFGLYRGAVAVPVPGRWSAFIILIVQKRAAGQADPDRKDAGLALLPNSTLQVVVICLADIENSRRSVANIHTC